MLSLSKENKKKVSRAGFLGGNLSQSTLENFLGYIDTDSDGSDSAVHDNDSSSSSDGDGDYSPKEETSAGGRAYSRVKKE